MLYKRNDNHLSFCIIIRKWKKKLIKNKTNKITKMQAQNSKISLKGSCETVTEFFCKLNH